MSNRFSKANDKPSAERTATGRPSGLREITHTGWKEWDGHMVGLKGYLRDHYPDMNSICPDPTKTNGPAPAYMIYKSRALDKVALAACTTDPEGVEQRKCLLAVYKDTLTLTTLPLFYPLGVCNACGQCNFVQCSRDVFSVTHSEVVPFRQSIRPVMLNMPITLGRYNPL